MLKKAVSIFVAVVMLLSIGTASAVASDEIAITGAMVRDAGLVTSDSFIRVSGLAGKLSSDSSSRLTIDENGGTLPLASSAINGGYPRYEIAHGFGFTSSTAPNTEATFQFNVYADGDTVVGGSLHTRDVLKWAADGTLYSISYPANVNDWTQTHTKIGSLKRGQWHTIALTFNSSTLDQKIYADGVYLTSVTRPNYPFNTDGSPKHTTMRVGAFAGSGKGSVALDDVYSYAGQYDASADALSVAVPDSRMKIDTQNKTIICSSDAFADASSFNEAVKTAFDANYAVLYPKSGLTEPCTDFEYGTVAINSKSTRGYAYYTVYDGTFIEEDFNDGAIDSAINTIQHCYGKYGVEYKGSVGAKSADDKALVIHTKDQNVELTVYNQPSVDLANRSGYDGDVVTVEADVYKSNMKVPAYVYMYYTNADGAVKHHAVATFSTYGQIHINGKDAMLYSANCWYKVAATYNKADSSLSVYVNGQLIDKYTLAATKVANRFLIASNYKVTKVDDTTAHIDSAQLPSETAVDNYRLSFAAYDASADNAKITVSEGLLIAGNKIIAKNYTSLTKAQVSAMITSPAGFEIYSDSTYQTVLSDDDTITADSVLVSKSVGGEVMEYYRFSEGSLGYIEYVQSDSKIKVSIVSTCADSDAYMLVVASYNGNKLVSADVKNSLLFGEATEAELNYDEELSYKAFVWTDNLKPERFAEYTE